MHHNMQKLNKTAYNFKSIFYAVNHVYAWLLCSHTVISIWNLYFGIGISEVVYKWNLNQYAKSAGRSDVRAVSL